MKYYVWVDKLHPQTNLVYSMTTENIELERVEVEVEEGEDIVQAVKNILGIN